MVCAHCRKDVTLSDRVGRESICPHCGAYLHSCVNCRFYSPGRHNDCSEPQAEPVTDKRGANFCDYFVVREHPFSGAGLKEEKRRKAKDQFDKLFGA